MEEPTTLTITWCVHKGEVHPHWGDDEIEILGHAHDDPERPMVRLVGTDIIFALEGAVRYEA